LAVVSGICKLAGFPLANKVLSRMLTRRDQITTPYEPSDRTISKMLKCPMFRENRPRANNTEEILRMTQTYKLYTR
jgi:hypothetical protein